MNLHILPGIKRQKASKRISRKEIQNFSVYNSQKKKTKNKSL